MRILLSVLFIFLLLPIGAAMADDAEREQQEQKLKQVRQQISSLLKRIEKEQSQKSGAEKELRSVERKLGKVRREIRKLDNAIKLNRKKLKKLENEQVAQRKQLAQQRKTLEAQLKAAYMAGSREQLKLILNQEDPAELSRIATYYDYVNKARAEQIRATQATMQRIQELSVEVEQENQNLFALSEQHEAQRQALNSNRKERQKVVDKIKAQLKQEGVKLSRLQNNEKEIEALLASLSELLSDIPDAPTARIPFSSLKGKLKWPTRGKPKNRFGASRQTGDLKWRGLMIDAPAGNKIRAVSSGRVAFADWFQGFGLIIIIDHDDGYLSLYGHNQALFKETGDWVERGELIAQVGDSGGLDKAALYFELRHKGQPIDPRRWCEKLS